MFSVNYFLMPDEVMMLSPVYYRPAEPETGLAGLRPLRQRLQE